MNLDKLWSLLILMTVIGGITAALASSNTAKVIKALTDGYSSALKVATGQA